MSGLGQKMYIHIHSVCMSCPVCQQCNSAPITKRAGSVVGESDDYPTRSIQNALSMNSNIEYDICTYIPASLDRRPNNEKSTATNSSRKQRT